MIRSLPGVLILGTVALAVTACAGASPAPTVAPAAPTSVAAAPAPALTTPGTIAPAVTAAPVASDWVMPALVGANLQDAQDAIQALTGYGIAITTSHDATGADRMQVSDRNWQVCSQSVAPGETITTGTRIDFGAVKLDEDC